MVFGRSAAKHAADLVKPGESHKPLPRNADEYALSRLDAARYADGSTPTAALRLELQNIMQSHCAVFRTGEVLGEGVEMMGQLWDKCGDLRVQDRSMIWNSDLVETLELDNLLYQARVSVSGAYNRARPGI